MGCEVYANNNMIACKAADGKTVAAFPDVCFSPPLTPATPPGVPIPYPNTAMASDTTDGSKTVMISGQEVMLKDKSCFKTSTGDEAGSAPKHGVVTSKIKGKANFCCWSMDVKFEGENVPRHLDLTGHNEASNPFNAPPWLYADKVAFENSGGKVCEEEKRKAKDACSTSTVKRGRRRNCSNECKEAQKCVLVPKKDDKATCCPRDTTGHHLVEVHCFTPTAGRNEGERLGGFSRYNDQDAPCVCASKPRHSGSHGILHSIQNQIEASFNATGAVLKKWPGAGPLIKRGGDERRPAESKWTYGQARDAGAFAHKTAFKHCNAVCIQNQLDAYHNKCGVKSDTPVRTDPVDRKGGPLSSDARKALEAEKSRLRGVATVGPSI
jgi:Domain of unknown function (DUF4150)/GHH signature containing HNH/Endo VII superfamily nuclease toxin  2